MSVRRITSFDAKNFHSASRHGSFFSCPEILERISDSVDWWGFFQGDEIACTWPVALDSDKKPVKNYFFTYYVGPMWAGAWPEFPAHKSSSFTHHVYNSFLDIFSQNYLRITYTLSTDLRDIRPFIWRNQTHDYEHHEIEVKYTAKLDLTSLDLILKNFRQVRRWELKNSTLIGLDFVYDKFEVADILLFYNENVPQSDSQQSPESDKVLLKYLILDKDLGVRSIRIREISSGQTVGFALLGIYKGTVNIIVNNVSKQYKENKSNVSTYLNYLIIQKFLEEGHASLDFNGANSPKLADSKHSFGAQAISYFKINSNFKLP